MLIEGSVQPASWAEELAQRRFSPQQPALRDYFRRGFEPDPDPALLLQQLISLHEFIDKHPADVQSIIAKIGQEFMLNRGNSLKTMLLGPVESRVAPAKSWDNGKFFECLASPTFAASFDPQKLVLSRQLDDLFNQDFPTARKLLIQLCSHHINAIGEEMLRHLIARLDLDQSLEIADLHPHLWRLLLSRHPEFAADPQVWRRGGSIRRNLLTRFSTGKRISLPENWCLK